MALRYLSDLLASATSIQICHGGRRWCLLVIGILPLILSFTLPPSVLVVNRSGKPVTERMKLAEKTKLCIDLATAAE